VETRLGARSWTTAATMNHTPGRGDWDQALGEGRYSSSQANPFTPPCLCAEKQAPRRPQCGRGYRKRPRSEGQFDRERPPVQIDAEQRESRPAVRNTEIRCRRRRRVERWQAAQELAAVSAGGKEARRPVPLGSPAFTTDRSSRDDLPRGGLCEHDVNERRPRALGVLCFGGCDLLSRMGDVRCQRARSSPSSVRRRRARRRQWAIRIQEASTRLAQWAGVCTVAGRG
jgi:hypothetical protein